MYTFIHPDKQSDRHAYINIGMPTDSEADRHGQTNGQSDGQTDRQTDIICAAQTGYSALHLQLHHRNNNRHGGLVAKASAS